MNKLIPSILGLLIFFNSSASLLAESSNHDTGTSNDSSSSSNSRAAQAEPLNDREMNFISNNFFLSAVESFNVIYFNIFFNRNTKFYIIFHYTSNKIFPTPSLPF
mgnify:CR=1 FL=1